MKKDFTKRISGASLFLIILLVVIGIFSMMRVYNSHNSIDEVARIDVPLIEILTNIETHQLQQSINFERAIRHAEEIGKYDQAQAQYTLADSLFRTQATLVDNELILAEEHVKKGISEAISDNQRIIMKDLLNALKKMEREHLSYERDAIAVLELFTDGQTAEAMDRVVDVEAKEEKLNGEIEHLLIELEKYTEESVNAIEVDERTTLRLVVLFTCFFVMISIVISFVASNSSTIPIDQLTEGVKRLSKGEKAIKISTPPSGLTSELTTTFNEMVIKLQDAQEEIERHMHFSYSTAHDLKAPITNLIELLDLLYKDADDHDKILQQAKTSAKQVQSIVLALNEVHVLREALDTKPEVLYFDQIVSEVEKGISSKIETSKVIVTKWFAKCPTIKYPSAQLKSIFQNLIINAIKYSSPNRLLEIEIESYRDNDHTVLEIRDNGIGFDSNVSGMEIMEPFKQLDPKKEGSGLGLYLIKTIIDHHHGHIEVKSKPGKGSIFTIYLN
ncbi:HAMP domain-containing histidine kinase [Reichenbachiella carrageenanivorans]|uniref:histidine kinase n=1 Tax=Reichenbachiella carrageenanivorans TaxID=2979869 RepID=A0ABY6D198_9BACT|nr:HAMP domain-containing sensor histidine kinase [Reichenbachiella carrageenanivorans]UXX79945.1 HAMP domain-containing histidine kinase [Reichenbachiella carrageenanivorans]